MVTIGLTSISVPELLPGEGNVHTGGLPPWLLGSDGKPLKTIPLKRIPGNAKSKSKYPQKLGWDIIRTGIIRAGPNFLPNYGSVWQEGSRGETRKEFRDKRVKYGK